MRSCISTARAAWKHPATLTAFEYGVERYVLRLVGCCLSFGFLVLATGCSKSQRSAQHADVSGKVLFQGQPLPGGRLTFISVKGGFASAGTIDEKGNYQINAPLGDVEIGVDNKMLRRRGGPKQPPHPKKPGSEEDRPITGRYVDIPSQYVDPHTSGLKYTVTPGAQTHNIELTNAPPPAPPGTPGS